MTEEECAAHHRQRLAVLEAVLEERVAAVREAIELKFQANDKAMVIQTVELARRLDFLNGEAERLRDMQATYIPREVYEARDRSVQEAIHGLDMFKANLTGRIMVTVAIASVIAGAASAAATVTLIRWWLP